MGRHRSADFVIDSPAASNVHGKVFAHTCDTGDTLVCYEDVSRSGTLYNDQLLLNKEAVILSHGDSIMIDACEFFYFHCASGKPLSTVEEDFWYTFPRDVADYQVTSRTLGSGAYAVVHLAVHQDSGRQRACKVIKKTLIAKKDLYDKVELEIRVLTHLKHPNILSFVDACTDAEHLYLMLELCTGGDLHSYVSRKQKLSGSETLFISYQLMKALDYLHNTAKVAHRDIKPENILLRNRGPYPHVLISDFGTISLEPTRPSMSFLGTLDYWAPECFTGSYIPLALDCYSLGCTMYLMLAGTQPFNRWEEEADKTWPKSSGDERVEQILRPDLQARLTKSDVMVAKKILNGCPPYQRDIGHVDSQGLSLIRSLMAPALRYRITILGALHHSWIQSNKNELETLYNRNVRV
ncbi:kinase-like protein [Cystobasidium minutum MCA 4210]|uniref:kinase-like protein n=1 Tax=Cystobasidium minutum MCA 4210 TaxID=1397322 RepID=UPI0034D01B00|eukprot:jgi/Rhomi1/50571/CE50570_136